jgi:chemotaxis protein CheD
MNKPVTYHLEPGYIFVSCNGAVIRTVLGSCVAVCVWDRRSLWGGMNHFLYPRPSQDDTPRAVFGTVAIPGLLKIMRDLGSRYSDLEAQIFGGACPHGRSNTTGKKNAELARDILKRRGVRVVSEDTGGMLGRKIVFDTSTGQTAVLKVHQLRIEDWQ